MKISGTDFGKAAKDYGTYRAGFPDSLFDRLYGLGVGVEGQVIVDLGTGTGTLARGFALRKCRVTGIDPDLRMIAKARELDDSVGVGIHYVEAFAEDTGIKPNQADVVTAGQCWHWFDRLRASREVLRILKPGGRLVIAHFDWLPLKGNVVQATEKLIEQYNPQWKLGGGLGMYPQWLPGLSETGFRDLETFSYDMDVPYSHQGWRGRIRASAGITALDAKTAEEFDGALANLLTEKYPMDPLSVPHRIFAIISRSPGA